MAKRVRSLRCPTCRKLVMRKDAEFPFCGERCRLIDLGKWASGAYVVSRPIEDPELISQSDLPGESGSRSDVSQTRGTNIDGKNRSRY